MIISDVNDRLSFCWKQYSVFVQAPQTMNKLLSMAPKLSPSRERLGWNEDEIGVRTPRRTEQGPLVFRWCLSLTISVLFSLRCHDDWKHSDTTKLWNSLDVFPLVSFFKYRNAASWPIKDVRPPCCHPDGWRAEDTHLLKSHLFKSDTVSLESS